MGKTISHSKVPEKIGQGGMQRRTVLRTPT